MSVSNYDNPDDAQALREELARREEQETHEMAENLSVKERLQRKRDDDTIEEEFMGETLEFRRPGANLQKRGIVLSQRFGDEDEDDLDPETVSDLVDFMTGALDELSIEDDLDQQFWGTFDFEQLEGVFENVIAAGVDEEVTPEEAEEFREE